MTIQDFKKEFDPRLNKFISEKVKIYKKLARNKETREFFNHLEEYTQDGKRIRPYCAYIGYKESGKKITDTFWYTAIALELIHVLALIHDDIIDRAPSRRKISSLHKFVQDTTKVLRGDHNHYANSQALLIGDLVFSAAFEALTLASAKKSVHGKIHQLLDEVIVGQMIDVNLAYQEIVTKSVITLKSKYKSALYTFARPLEVGAILGNVSPVKVLELAKIGESLGLAYQTQDDALDIFGSEEILKKKLFNDIREGQQTFLTNYFYSKASEKQVKKFNSFFGKNFSNKRGLEVIAIMEETGTKSYIKKEITKYFRKTSNLIESSNLSKKTSLTLTELLNSVRKDF